MVPLPESDLSPLLRTDFTDDAAWSEVREEVDDGWVTVVADPRFQGLPPERLLEAVPVGRVYPVLVVADAVTFAHDDRALLVVDLVDEPGRAFRADPRAVRSIVGNLAIQNAYFGDYADSAGDGVHRLSPKHFQALAELSGNPPDPA